MSWPSGPLAFLLWILVLIVVVVLIFRVLIPALGA
jgi:hypothetical protein